jgi:RND superfamily putative drug exporter
LGQPSRFAGGAGLAVAIFLDATIVRGLLVPAVMSVSGEHNSYLPRCIDRLLPPQDVDPQELPASPAAFRQAA